MLIINWMMLLSEWSEKSHTYALEFHEKNLPNKSIVVYKSFMTSMFTERKSKKKKFLFIKMILFCCVVLLIFVRFILFSKKISRREAQYMYPVNRKIKSSRIKVVYSNNLSNRYIPVSFINRFGIDSMLILVSFLKCLKSDSNGTCNR